MGRRLSMAIDHHHNHDHHHKKLPKQKSKTLPSSPTHSSSSSSSSFEFTIALSPRKSTTTLIPADQLFYKGQLLPLHLSPRLSMVRTLLLSSSSSSSDTTTTTSRDSTASNSSSDTHSRDSSARPSSVTDDDSNTNPHHNHHLYNNTTTNNNNKKYKYFSLSRFSSVFRKETNSKNINHNQSDHTNLIPASSLKTKPTAKDVIRRYLKKVKPLYEKLSQKQRATTTCATLSSTHIGCITTKSTMAKDGMHSFSGNLGYPRQKNCASSCPSSMRSSPTHSAVLTRKHMFGTVANTACSSGYNSESSSMEELQNAIQGAIAYCKNSMNNNNIIISRSGASTSSNNNNTE